MIDRLGIEERDIRILTVIVLIMTLVMMFVVEGSLLARAIVGVVMGTVTTLVFLLTTAVLNRFKP